MKLGYPKKFKNGWVLAKCDPLKLTQVDDSQQGLPETGYSSDCKTITTVT